MDNANKLSDYEVLFIPRSLYSKIDWNRRGKYYAWKRSQAGRVVTLLDTLKLYHSYAARWSMPSDWPGDG